MRRFFRSLSAAAALASIAAAGCGPSLPAPLAPEAARTGPGKVTVIEFIDFECPFCRHNHQILAALVNVRQDRVRVVRKHVPLEKHRHARSAALAAVCAEAQGKGDEMAGLLVTAPVPHLGANGCEELAVELGLDIDRFRTCVTDPATAARVREDEALFDAVDGAGVPLVFVGARRFTGLQDEQTLETALVEALREAAP